MPSIWRPDVSEGERSIFISYVSVAVIGSWMAYVVEHRLAGGQSLMDLPTLYDVWSIVSGAVGAVFAVYLGRKWLGHNGVEGVRGLAMAIPVTTFVAALVGGTLVLPFYGTMFGPLALVGTFIDKPLLLLLWIATLFGANLAHGIHRRERETIFTAPIPQ